MWTLPCSAWAGGDLVVLNESGTEVVGAYPMTVEAAPHGLKVNGEPVNAMCALDALSVCSAHVRYGGHVSGESIHIHQRGREVLAATALPEVRVGVRWQQPGACAPTACVWRWCSSRTNRRH